MAVVVRDKDQEAAEISLQQEHRHRHRQTRPHLPILRQGIHQRAELPQAPEFALQGAEGVSLFPVQGQQQQEEGKERGQRELLILREEEEAQEERQGPSEIQ